MQHVASSTHTLHTLTFVAHKLLSCCCSCFKGDIAAQNKLKHFITEETFLVNEKYAKPVQVAAYHNLCMATNNDNAIDLKDNSERRVCFMECKTPDYTQDHWNRLHALTWDQEVAEIFYSYLCDETLVDTSGFIIGKALTTHFKKQNIAKQRPIAAIMLQRLVEEPDYMKAYAIRSGRYMHMDDSDLDKLVLKHRPTPSMLDHVDPKTAVTQEINEDRRQSHAMHLNTDISKDFFFEMIKSVFSHQTLHGRDKSDDAYNNAMRDLLGPYTTAPTITVKIRFALDNSGRVTRGYRLPSVEGLKHILQTANYWAMDD
jgi:hypothetical protein